MEELSIEEKKKIVFKQYLFRTNNEMILDKMYNAFMSDFKEADKLCWNLKRVHIINSSKCRHILIRIISQKVPEVISKIIHEYVGWNAININVSNNDVEIIYNYML